MAVQANLQLYLNTDFNFLFTIYNSTETSIVDVSLWALSWIVKTSVKDIDALALITKTTVGGGISVTGTYSSSPATNTQQINVDIDDTNTTNISPGNYIWELRRTDDGNETILALGNIAILASAHGF